MRDDKIPFLLSNEGIMSNWPKPPQDASPRSKDRLHGITLEMMLNRLVNQLGWAEMGTRIRIRCFTDNPSIASSLKFLRKTPWARTKVERLYLRHASTE
jgi:uncharacterized protein (DUF2132 family)